jgi:quercetin dioxygenase-like cupin family protein
MSWHPESRRQYLVVLSGQLEVGVGDSSVRVFSPGDVLMAEDLTGQGHTTRTVSEGLLVVVTIPIADKP